MNKWTFLQKTLGPIVAQEPGLVGIQWPLFFFKPGAIVRPAELNALLHTVSRHRQKHIPPADVWYVLHGYIPSHVHNFDAVSRALSSIGLRGHLLGPVPYKSHGQLHGTWQQWDMDKCLAWPNVMRATRILAQSHLWAHEIKQAFSHADGVHEYFGTVPDHVYLTAICYRALTTDRAVAAFIEKNQPRAIVAGIDQGFYLAPFMRQARLAGIPSFVIQHGNQGEYAGQVLSDFALLWGEYYRRRTIDLGAPKGKLRVCGAPRMDWIVQSMHEVHKDEHNLFAAKTKPDDPVILFISEGHFEHIYPDGFVTALKEKVPTLLKTLDTLGHIAVKLHPGEDRSQWVQRHAFSQAQFIDGRSSVYRAMQQADVVIAVGSVAGLEGAYLNKPVVWFRPGDSSFLTPFADHGVGIVAETAEQALVHCKAVLLEDGVRAEVLASSSQGIEHFYANRGRSAQEVAAFIAANIQHG
jgi:hypothetical protein